MFVPQPDSIDDTSYFVSRFSHISSGVPDDEHCSNSGADSCDLCSDSGDEVNATVSQIRTSYLVKKQQLLLAALRIFLNPCMKLNPDRSKRQQDLFWFGSRELEGIGFQFVKSGKKLNYMPTLSNELLNLNHLCYFHSCLDGRMWWLDRVCFFNWSVTHELLFQGISVWLEFWPLLPSADLHPKESYVS